MIRLREIVLIQDLKRQGLSVSAIARQVGCDRKTVRKYLDLGLEAPVYGPGCLVAASLMAITTTCVSALPSIQICQSGVS